MKQPSQAKAATTKNVILFLAANPPGTSQLALDREAHAIHLELKRSGYRDRFDGAAARRARGGRSRLGGGRDPVARVVCDQHSQLGC